MSITIIDKTKPLPPILVHKPKPLFKTTLDKQRYWGKQKEYWIDGYNGLPGLFYFGVQEGWIKHRSGEFVGQTKRKMGRDVDLLIAESCQKAMKVERPECIIKGRGMGLSSIGGDYSNYFMRCYPGSTSLVTGKDQSQIMDIFQNKITPVYDSLDPDIKGKQISRNETKPLCYLKVAYSYYDDDGNAKSGLSEVVCRETTQNPKSASGFSGRGAKFGFYDEWPLHHRREELLRSSISCYRDSRTKKMDGLLLLGGTVEDTLSNDELSELQKTLKNSDLWNIDILFIPFWMGMCDNNGHSDEKAGMEWWDKEASRLEKMDDDAGLRAHRMNNPRTIEDIFELTSGSRLEQDNADRVKSHHKIIVSSNIPITTCRFTELSNSIETIVDKKGAVSILEHPKPGIEYRLLIDGVATGTKTGEDEGSCVAGTIVKGFDPEGDSYSPVCLYEERPEIIENSYRILINEAKYYNKFGGLKSIHAEANAGNADHFVTILEKEGMIKYAAFRKDLSGKGNSNKKKYFTYVTKDVRDWQVKMLNIYLRKYCHHIKMVRFLEDMMKALSENADALDSFLMFFVDTMGKYDEVVKKIVIPQKEISVLERGPDGTVRWVTKKINL